MVMGSIYSILYGKYTTGMNFPKQYQKQTSLETMLFAFDKRLPYITAPAGTQQWHHLHSVGASMTLQQALGLTNENTVRLLAAR